MPAQKKSLQETVADKVEPFLDDLSTRVAELQRPVDGNVRVSKDERRARWWQEASGWTPEHERLLLTARTPDGAPVLDPMTGQPIPPLSPEHVGLLKYENRQIDMLAAGKSGTDDRSMAEYARDMTALGPPAPDPLEMAAMDTGGAPGAQGESTVPPVASLPPAPEMAPPAVAMPEMVQPMSPTPMPMGGMP